MDNSSDDADSKIFSFMSMKGYTAVPITQTEVNQFNNEEGAASKQYGPITQIIISFIIIAILIGSICLGLYLSKGESFFVVSKGNTNHDHKSSDSGMNSIYDQQPENSKLIYPLLLDLSVANDNDGNKSTASISKILNDCFGLNTADARMLLYGDSSTIKVKQNWFGTKTRFLRKGQSSHIINLNPRNVEYLLKEVFHRKTSSSLSDLHEATNCVKSHNKELTKIGRAHV